MLVHVPCELDSAHDLQGPAQAELQQTPCAQIPDMQSTTPLLHEAPFIFLPHELPLHTFGITQLLSLVHASKHFEPLQANGAQVRDDGATHWLTPSQADWAV
jgi:hypothetical protein